MNGEWEAICWQASVQCDVCLCVIRRMCSHADGFNKSLQPDKPRSRTETERERNMSNHSTIKQPLITNRYYRTQKQIQIRTMMSHTPTQRLQHDQHCFNRESPAYYITEDTWRGLMLLMFKYIVWKNKHLNCKTVTPMSFQTCILLLTTIWIKK